MIRSKFKFRAFVILILLFVFVGIGLAIVIPKLPISIDKIRFIDFYTATLFLLSIAWLFFGELRTKVIRVEVKNHSIRKRNYLGFDKEYDFRFFDGFKTSVIRSKGEEYEYLYLMKDGNKIVKLSETYHQNYKQLKLEISKHTQNMGFEKFSFIDEIKEIFK